MATIAISIQHYVLAMEMGRKRKFVRIRKETKNKTIIDMFVLQKIHKLL